MKKLIDRIESRIDENGSAFNIYFTRGTKFVLQWIENNKEEFANLFLESVDKELLTYNKMKKLKEILSTLLHSGHQVALVVDDGFEDRSLIFEGVLFIDNKWLSFLFSVMDFSISLYTLKLDEDSVKTWEFVKDIKLKGKNVDEVCEELMREIQTNGKESQNWIKTVQELSGADKLNSKFEDLRAAVCLDGKTIKGDWPELEKVFASKIKYWEGE